MPEIPDVPILRWRDLRRADRILVAGAALLVLGAAVVLVIVLARQGRTPIGDEAVIARISRHAPAELRSVGQITTATLYGADGPVYQPGPAQFWLEWPFVTLLGVPVGVIAFAVAINTGCALLAGWAAVRVGGVVPGLLTLLAVFLMAPRTIDMMFASSWNATIVVIPMFCLFVLAWAVAAGDHAHLAGMVVTSSFVLQGELPNAGPVLAAVAVAVLFTVFRLLGRPREPALIRSIAWAAGAWVLLWSLPLVDQVAGNGNLGNLLALSLPHAGWVGSLHIGSTMADVGGVLVQPGVLEPGDVRTRLWPFVLSVVAVAVVLAGRRRDLRRHAGLLCVSGSVFLGCLGWAAFRPPDDPFAYHLYWVKASGWFLLLALAVVLVGGLGAGSHAVDVGIRALVVGALAVAVVWAVVSESSRWSGLNQGGGTTSPIVNQLVAGVEAHGMSGPTAAVPVGGYVSGRILQAVQARVDELVDPGDAAGGAVAVSSGLPLGVPHGKVIARAAAKGSDPARSRSVTRAVRDWARQHGPVVLTDDGANNLPIFLDGTAPSVCTEGLRSDPARIADLDPSVITGMYLLGWVQSPALPQTLSDEVQWWSNHMEYQIVSVSSRHLDGSDGMLLSDDRC